MTDRSGTVYILHFSKNLAHAKHYIGFTTDLNQRIKDHHAGNSNSAKIMQAVKQNSITFIIGNIFKNKTRSFERNLKNQKHSNRYCAICNKNIEFIPF
jgi:predicted GIY-YIG superfamily endonuclease